MSSSGWKWCIRVKMEIKRYVNELGTEGRLISMQMEELVGGVEEEAWFLLKDYAKDPSEERVREIAREYPQAELRRTARSAANS